MPFAKPVSFKPGVQVVYTGAQVDQIMGDIFDDARQPRSFEYQMGCRDVLVQYLCQCPAQPFPFDPGEVQFDAYIAGRDEGRAVAQAHIFGDLNIAGGAA